MPKTIIKKWSASFEIRSGFITWSALVLLSTAIFNIIPLRQTITFPRLWTSRKKSLMSFQWFNQRFLQNINSNTIRVFYIDFTCKVLNVVAEIAWIWLPALWNLNFMCHWVKVAQLIWYNMSVFTFAYILAVLTLIQMEVPVCKIRVDECTPLSAALLFSLQ